MAGEEANWLSYVTVPTTELGPEATEADGEAQGNY